MGIPDRYAEVLDRYAEVFLVNLNDGTVDECILKVTVFAHGFEKTLKYTRLGPPSKPPELGIPMTKGRRQIPPRREVVAEIRTSC